MKNNLYKPWMSRKECEENVEFLLSKIKSNFISFIISIILILTTFIIYIVALNNLNVKLLTLVPYFYTFDILFLLIDLIRFIVLKEKALEMGSSTSFSASEAADGLTYLALAGWDVETQI